MSAPRRLLLSLGLVAAIVSLAVFFMVVRALFAPADEPDTVGAEPLEPLMGLLDLHGLLGRQPEERPDEQRAEPVARDDLERWVTDLDGRDPFITDIYVGFVVGALARHQGRLFLERRGPRATAFAGDVRVALARTGEGWKVVLEESIPEEIRRRAALEHQRLLPPAAP